MRLQTDIPIINKTKQADKKAIRAYVGAKIMRIRENFINSLVLKKEVKKIA